MNEPTTATAGLQGESPQPERTTLAICIPTYNRCRYLASLLEHLASEFADFPYTYEIVISDNASEDGTEALVRSWSEKLPIRYFRQAENIGPYRNVAFIFDQSKSIFSLNVADDDLLDGDGVRMAIERLLGEPEAVILYAPWTMFNRVQNTSLTNFYDIPGDITVNQGNFLHLLLLILQHHIFAEIFIVRTDALHSLLPRENEIAHWPFTVPAEYLTIGKVLFQKKPFYKSVTAYFADDHRAQGGVGEAQHWWDRYRGGLEHLLGLSLPQLKPSDVPMVHDSIREFVVARMLVALRLRITLKGNPLDTYYLASRLRGLGAVSRLPRPMNDIRAEAALWFISHDESLLDGVRQIALVGAFEPAIANHLRTMTDLPVVVIAQLPDEIDASIMVLKGKEADYSGNLARYDSAGNKLIFEDRLMNKFL